MTELGTTPRRVQYIIAGQYHATSEPTEVRTLLGSCVAACLFDPGAGVGGMNHFLLPNAETADEDQTARYGGYAMELLITDIMKKGGDRRKLHAKIFGGASVLPLSGDHASVGQRNVAFVREYLDAESVPICAESVGGTVGVRVHFWPHSGRAFIQRLEKSKLQKLREREAQYRQNLNADKQVHGGDITLF